MEGLVPGRGQRGFPPSFGAGRVSPAAARLHPAVAACPGVVQCVWLVGVT